MRWNTTASILGVLAGCTLGSSAFASYIGSMDCIRNCPFLDCYCQWRCMWGLPVGSFEFSPGYTHAGGGKKYLNFEGQTATTLHYLPGEGLPHAIEAVTFRIWSPALGAEGKLLGTAEVGGDGAYELAIDLTEIPLGGVIAAEIHYDGILDIQDFGCVVYSFGAVSIPCASDFDCSGFVDLEDYIAFVGAFEQGNASADYDGSGFVDLDDFVYFVNDFEAGC